MLKIIFKILYKMINPLNNTLANTLQNMQGDINTLNRARQPFISDWHEVSEPATAAITGIITFSSGFNPVGTFSAGDRIRLKQGGGYKYFFCIAVGSTTIAVDGGTDYTCTAAAVTDLALSKLPNPTGHPGFFNYNANPGASPGTLGVAGPNQYTYTVTGTVCLFFIEHVANVQGSASTVTYDVPLFIDYSIITQWEFIMNCEQAGAGANWWLHLGSVLIPAFGPNNKQIQVTNGQDGLLSTALWSNYISFSYKYDPKQYIP